VDFSRGARVIVKVINYDKVSETESFLLGIMDTNSSGNSKF